jgi:hypothetical protein
MTPEELTYLKETYTGRIVKVEAVRPELAPWANVPGKVITINCSGRALVQFEGPDQSWYDIEPEYLDIVQPTAKVEEESKQ